MKKNPVVHFEMPYEDGERLSKFYNQAFGWEMKKLGQEMGNYITAATTETDENQMVKTPGTINGGFYPKDPGFSPYPSVVISVENLDEAVKNVKDAGGKITEDVMDIPGVGKYVAFTDTEGNRVGMLQAVRM